eukprot:COSAG01_NODE_1807_length_9189_cov_24.677778_11_plen_163_part_00
MRSRRHCTTRTPQNIELSVKRPAVPISATAVACAMHAPRRAPEVRPPKRLSVIRQHGRHQHAACSMQHAACSMQHAACSMRQRLASVAEPSWCPVEFITLLCQRSQHAIPQHIHTSLSKPKFDVLLLPGVRHTHVSLTMDGRHGVSAVFSLRDVANRSSSAT